MAAFSSSGMSRRILVRSTASRLWLAGILRLPIVVLSSRRMAGMGSLLVLVELLAIFPVLWLGSLRRFSATTARRNWVSLRSASRHHQDPSRWSVPGDTPMQVLTG